MIAGFRISRNSSYSTMLDPNLFNVILNLSYSMVFDRILFNVIAELTLFYGIMTESV